MELASQAPRPSITTTAALSKPGVGIRADGVGQMMIHKPHLRFGRTEMIREKLESAVLVGHARVQPRGVQRIQIGERILAAHKTLQIRGKDGERSRPALANEIELVGTHFREIQTGANGKVRKAGIVLDPADAFLGHRKE